MAKAGLAKLRQHCAQVQVNPHDRPLNRDELMAGVRDADGLIAMLTDRIDGPLLDAAVKLKGVANHAVGFNNVDLEAANRRHIPISNTPDVLTDATADMTWALLLATARRLGEGERLARSGRWQGWHPLQLLGCELAGSTLAVIGAGRIGTAVVRRSQGFGMEVLYVDSRRCESLEADYGAQRIDLAEALTRADFVSLHVPLNDETHHLLGAEQFKLMKATAILLNTSRGPVVDEAALIEALQNGIIGAAGLDVYEREPEIPPQLRQLDNVVLLPHLGSATVLTRDRMALTAVDNMLAMLRGARPPNLVNQP